MRNKQDTEKTDQSGFTLIELMVTLSVAIIILSVGVPNYRGFVQDSLLIAQSNSFHSAIALTKSEAIKRSSRVTLCPSSNGTSCTGGTAWSNGWIVFTNPNGNNVVDAGDEILQVGAALSGGSTLSGGKTRITFTSNGFSMGSNDTFSLCDSRGATYSKVLVLNNQGRIHAETGTGTCS